MEVSEKELSPADFKATQSNWITYSKDLCKHLPPGSITEFKWKDYSPAVFRLIRELDNIDHDDYVMSVCSAETVRKVCSLARPGSVCLLSKDDRFAIKTLRKSEVKVILGMLPSYFNHLNKFSSTILSKLYGVHVVKPDGGMKVYFLVTSNVFQSDKLMHKCYDLKGSLQGRRDNKLRLREKVILKDQDFDFRFYLDPLIRHRLLAQLKQDCEFLEAAGIMDYSLMIGLHVKKAHQGSFDHRSTHASNAHTASADTVNSPGHIRICSELPSKSSLPLKRCSTSATRGCAPSRKFNVLRASFQENEPTEISVSETWLQSTRSKFGEEMPARAVRTSTDESISGSSRHNLKARGCYEVLLYFEIVDICQDYGLAKRIEHAYKSLHFNPKMIAAVNPKIYSSRFQSFISDIFKSDDSIRRQCNRIFDDGGTQP